MKRPIIYWQQHSTGQRDSADISAGSFPRLQARKQREIMPNSHQPQASNCASENHRLVGILLWAAVAVYMIGIWILSSIDPRLTDLINATAVPDFFLHLGLYAGLAFLAIAAIRNTWPRQAAWLSAVQGAGVALSYSLLDEIHQNFVPGRGTEAQDIAGNLGGVILAAAFLILWQRLKTWHR